MKKLTILVLMALLVTVGFVLPSARMVNAAPAAPTLVSPANDGTVTGTSVTFEWGSIAGAVKYQLLVSTSTDILDATKYKRNVDLVGEDNTTYNDTGYPASGTKYYWWVWAYAADGTSSAWAEVSANGRNFTNLPSIGAPTLVSPDNGAIVVGGTVTFQWGTLSGAVNYRIIVSTSTNVLDSTKYKCNVDLVGEATTTYVDTGYAANGTKYYWWVWACHADGTQSLWSEVSANGRWFSTHANATITITPPGGIAFGTLSYASFNEKVATSGRVTVTPGSSGGVSWSVTATGSTGIKPGFMVTGSTALTNPLLIGYTLAAPGPELTPSQWTAANGVAIYAGLHSSGPILAGPLTYSGVAATGTLDFCARQYLESGDTTTGAYSCAITFTATCLP